jgi:acyl-CoA synthetase (AMP-forming)/AMP-acid ligase II
MATAPDLVALHAAATPDRPALVEGAASLTWGQLNRLANRVASVLAGLGITPGDKVVWCGPNGAEVVTLIAGGRKAGVVSVPLNYRLTPEESIYVIDNSDAVAVLFDVEQAAQLAAAPAGCPKVAHWLAFRCSADEVPAWAEHLESLADDASEQDPVPPDTDEADDGSGATMIYTSGTTGRPKGALRRGADPQVAAALVAHIGFVPDDVYLTTGPLYHSGPLGFMAMVQAVGGSVVVQRHFDAEGWLALVERHRVTTTFSAPTPIRRVLDLPESVRTRYDCSSLQRVVANAAPWPFDLKRRYAEAFGVESLWEVYGSTELGVNTILRPEDQLRKPGSCGRPAPLVEVALFDEGGRRVDEVGRPGELFVRSGGAFDTYYKAEDSFEESRRGEWLTVGDIAFRDDEGFYFICDRKKDMIISGGMNVYPAEVEAVLVAHPDVADAAVFGVPSEDWGEAVHAVVATYPGREVGDEELTAFAREHLASYKVPRSLSRIDEIPRTGSGKALKRDLRAPYWEGRRAQVG